MKPTSAYNLAYFIKNLQAWFTYHDRAYPWRKKSASNYQRIVCEILLQRTRADVVANTYRDFFRRFPSWSALASASTDEIGEVLKPLGLWKRRSETLSALARVMQTRRGRFPRKRVDIEQLPGMGQYVTNSVELFVQGKPLPLLDVNMARLIERYFGPRKLTDIRYDPYLQELSRKIIENAENPVTMNWAILDFAALVCKKNSPSCSTCPLSTKCKSNNK
jgi:A/G-specific adenine glycosylase